MKRIFFSILSILCIFAFSTAGYGEQDLVAKKVARAPVLDGSGTDSIWAEVQGITTYDPVAKINIDLKAAYTDSDIFFLVSFPDPDESRTHKSWIWDKKEEIYTEGKDTEDCFHFKFNMADSIVDLSIYADNPYRADVWFWKAARTDPGGYADDKHCRLSSSELKDSRKVTSKSGKTMYLLRDSDDGKSAYKKIIPGDYEGDRIPSTKPRTPAGSRADVKAKGLWSAGRWTIEFSRPLRTGNADDIQFDTSKTYQIGVSRFVMAGKPSKPDISQPLFRSGDITEPITLSFGLRKKEEKKSSPVPAVE